MDDILDQYNHIAYQNNGKACILVIENKEEVTAAAEILPESLSLDVIKEKHIIFVRCRIRTQTERITGNK